MDFDNNRNKGINDQNRNEQNLNNKNNEFNDNQSINQSYKSNYIPNSNFNNNPTPGNSSNPPTPQQPSVNPQQPNPGANDDNKKLEPTSLKSLKQLGQNNPATSVESDIHTIPIIGQIEGHLVLPPKNKTTKYEHIIPQLVAIEENPKIKGLLIVLNTVGGDVEAGLAISEMISSMNKPTVSIVLGGGHSIGVPIAVSTDYSFIAPTATMIVHPIRLTGNIIGVPQTYEYLDKMQERIISFVIKHSEITKDKFRELMFQTGKLVRDVGTVLIGEKAVEHKIIHEVGGLYEAINKLRFLINQRSGGNIQ